MERLENGLLEPTATSDYSYFTPYGYQSGSCGYCKDEETSQRTPQSRACYYVNSKTLTVEHYQALVDRGWRSLPVDRFVPSRDQRKTLNRWNRFVLGQNNYKEKLKKPKTKQEKAKERNGFDFSAAVHEAEQCNVDASCKPEHTFVVDLESSSFTKEKYALYAHYQATVHKDAPSAITKKGFTRFLCDSPLTSPGSPASATPNSNKPTSLSASTSAVPTSSKPLGTFHQTYRLDGRLVALAVLDLLPHAVSAVYFLYHSDIQHWSPGKLSALREASLAAERGYGYYYMGYYIHSCAKMRYKGEYKPQFVLDTGTGSWFEMDGRAKAEMDGKGFVDFATLNGNGERGGGTTVGGSEPETDVGSDAEAEAEAEAAETSAGQIVSRERNGGEEDEEKLMYPKPQEAAAAGLSLLDLGFPGVMRLEQVCGALQPGNTVIRSRGIYAPASMLVAWDEETYADPRSISGLVVELLAALGGEVSRKAVVLFE